MALTLGTTGMDKATQAEVHAAFKVANASCGNLWTLVTDDSAEYTIVDMDSLYGPMSWIKLQGSGRKVIGLTSSTRSQVSYRLPRPIKTDDLAVLLSEIIGEESGETAANPPARAADQSRQAPEPVSETVAVEPAHTAQAQAKPLPDTPKPAAPAIEREPPVVQLQPVAADQTPRTLRGWIGMQGAAHRVRVTALNGAVVLVDAKAGLWHGPKELKAIVPCFNAEPGEVTSEILDDAAWEAEAKKIGASQPLSRLQWLGGLLSNNPTQGHYQLRKWPQIEREYPRHFRIATVMMKSAAGIPEIAEAAGVPEEEVRGFVNANLATGYAASAAETVAATSSPEPAPTKPTSGAGKLFGRLRK